MSSLCEREPQTRQSISSHDHCVSTRDAGVGINSGVVRAVVPLEVVATSSRSSNAVNHHFGSSKLETGAYLSVTSKAFNDSDLIPTPPNFRSTLLSVSTPHLTLLPRGFTSFLGKQLSTVQR